MQSFGICCLFLAVLEMDCSDLAGKEDIHHWGAERDVGARCAQSLAEAEQGAQLLPGEVDKKS